MRAGVAQAGAPRNREFRAGTLRRFSHGGTETRSHCRLRVSVAPCEEGQCGTVERKCQTRRTRWFEVSAIHIDPAASKSTADGRRSDAAAAGPPSPPKVGAALPTTVVTMPAVSMRRMTLLLVSAT